MTEPECLGSGDPDDHDWLRIERDGTVVQVYCRRCRIGPIDLLPGRIVLLSEVRTPEDILGAILSQREPVSGKLATR